MAMKTRMKAQESLRDHLRDRLAVLEQRFGGEEVRKVTEEQPRKEVVAVEPLQKKQKSRIEIVPIIGLFFSF